MHHQATYKMVINKIDIQIKSNNVNIITNQSKSLQSWKINWDYLPNLKY
jgi:hypothetical protein